MSDDAPLSGGEALLAILIAWKGHSVARRLRREARYVRRGGLRYKALRGAARSADRASEDPVSAARVIAKAFRSRRGTTTPAIRYWD